ncbi:MAG: LamG domain-containing protein, partial [Pseudoalteromonas sp.]|nr:LamG domain-containing protein [Pseudoalteromonas sp.]
PTVLNTSNGIFSKWNTSSGDWSFISAIINDKPYISFSTTGSDNNELTGATDIVVDQMYMITATYDGSTLKLYANGVEDANSLSVTGNVYISSESLRIGSVRDNNIGSILYFTGSLAMPMIYNRALTSTEITALYNEGTVPCYADIDTSITDDCVYAPPLYNGADVSVGQELTDQSTSGITTTAVGSPPYTDQGLQVECQN